MKEKKISYEWIHKYFSLFKNFFLFLRGKYGAILFIFIISIWYNVVVVPTDELGKNDALKVSEEKLSEISADLSGSIPEKIYPDILDSIEGDWYRIGVGARALDSDEELHILAISDWGEEKEIGIVQLDRSGEEVFKEFVFQLNDFYHDIIIRKSGETQEDRWRGGKVIISDIFTTRLKITDETAIKNLQPTLLRKSQIASVFVDNKVEKEIFFPDRSNYISWGTFVSPGDVMYSVSIPARRGDILSDERYVLDIFGYDPESKVVDKKIIHSVSFPEADIDKYKKKTGMSDIPFPFSLKPGKSYALGIRYREKDKKGTLEFSRVTSDDGKEGFVVAQIRHAFEENEKNLLLPGAKIEDVGPYLRYEYRSNNSISDFANISEATPSISFKPKESRVLGDSKVGEYFMYPISTISPFSEMTIQASQYGNYEDQIALEYSYDAKNWKEIPYIQLDGKSQEYSFTFTAEKGDTALIYVRVRYTDSKDEVKRKFGLERFRITAKIPKK
ncbi:MAG: hypothetical protein IPN70_05030 [Candidatus Moraniibacteriota bacterium]|nr:MAG: hypothetical protein IPN70_05030 [Candidatus Moranbacteria bacterium]